MAPRLAGGGEGQTDRKTGARPDRARHAMTSSQKPATLFAGTARKD